MSNNHTELSLHLPAKASFERLAEVFVHESLIALELAQEEASKLTKAAHQVFSHLTETELQNQAVNLICKGDASIGQVDFNLAGREAAAHGHSRSAGAAHRLIEHIALAISVGQVDRFSTTLEKTNITRLSLVKERASLEESLASLPLPTSALFSIIRPVAAIETLLLIQYIRQKYAPEYLPPVFRHAQKVGDRMQRGEIHALAALSRNGTLCGAIFWEEKQHKMVFCNGAYVFNEDKDLAGKLVEGMLQTLAKHHSVLLVNTYPTTDFPAHEWEKAGSLLIYSASAAQPFEREVFMRSMIEDAGSVVWSHAALHPYLKPLYQQLALPREVQLAPLAKFKGEATLSAEYERDMNQIILRPLAAGHDNSLVLAEHVSLLREHGIYMLLFEMDLGVPQQSAYTPALLENGFTPRLLLPHAGEGDLVIFQHQQQGMTSLAGSKNS